METTKYKIFIALVEKHIQFINDRYIKLKTSKRTFANNPAFSAKFSY